MKNETVNTTPTVFAFADTCNGRVRGYRFRGTYTFKGIPYAVADRFMPPEKPAKWEGFRSALTYGEVSPLGSNRGTLAAFTEYSNSNMVENENCQFLNIWTQSLDHNAKKPVIFWLHGGGFAEGASNELAGYDGNNISEFGDVVFVSINHRLNVIGYLDLSAYGDKYRYSGSVGTLDIIMALEWVRDNIAFFGGDPDNVTLVGQSGGGGKTWMLLGMPKARGLFKRAWMLSGRCRGITPEDSKKQTDRILDYLNIKSDEVEKIEKLPLDDLLRASRATRFKAMPVIDSELYPEITVTEDGYISDMVRDIPVITSWTMGEMNSNLQKQLFEMQTEHEFEYTDDQIKELMKQRFGSNAEKVAEEFPKAYPGHRLQDVLYMVPRNNYESIAKAKQGGAPVYEAVFAWTLPLFGGVVSWHTGGDVAYLFRNSDKLDYIVAGDEEGAHKLEEAASEALIAYAYTGDPGTKRHPWPVFTLENRATMIFDTVSETRYHFDEKLNPLIPPVQMPDMMVLQKIGNK